MRHPDGRGTTVPAHGNRDMVKGALRDVLNEVGLTIDELAPMKRAVWYLRRRVCRSRLGSIVRWGYDELAIGANPVLSCDQTGDLRFLNFGLDYRFPGSTQYDRFCPL